MRQLTTVPPFPDKLQFLIGYPRASFHVQVVHTGPVLEWLTGSRVGGYRLNFQTQNTPGARVLWAAW